VLNEASRVNREAARARLPLPAEFSLRQTVDAWRRAREAYLTAKAEGRVHPDFRAWEQHELTARRADEALREMYTDEDRDRLRRLRDGDSAVTDWALTFLEADPWAFRSGYWKERILTYVARLPLSAEQTVRLEDIVVRHVDVGDRREFRYSCRVARRLDGDRLRRQLAGRCASDDPGVRRRAVWMLTAAWPTGLGPLEVDAVHTVLIDAVTSYREWWRVVRWVRPLVVRYEDERLRARLLAMLRSGDDENADIAMRLLCRLNDHGIGAGDADMLAVRLLRAVDRGDFGPIGGLAHLARHAGMPKGLRQDLLTRTQGSDESLARRAATALRELERPTSGGVVPQRPTPL